MAKHRLMMSDAEEAVAQQLGGYLVILEDRGYRGDAALVAAAILALTESVDHLTQAVWTVAQPGSPRSCAARGTMSQRKTPTSSHS